MTLATWSWSCGRIINKRKILWAWTTTKCVQFAALPTKQQIQTGVPQCLSSKETKMNIATSPISYTLGRGPGRSLIDTFIYIFFSTVTCLCVDVQSVSCLNGGMANANAHNHASHLLCHYLHNCSCYSLAVVCARHRSTQPIETSQCSVYK